MRKYVKECSEEIWQAAEWRAKQLPVLNNSHRENEANEVGALGEVVAEVWMKKMGVQFRDERDCTTHDYRLTLINKTLDVKTKDRTVKPENSFACSVPLYNHAHQKPDFYLFISLLRNNDKSLENNIRRFTTAYIVGASDQELLEQQGKLWLKNQIDPANGTRFWTDCLNLEIKQLIPPTRALEIWKSSVDSASFQHSLTASSKES